MWIHQTAYQGVEEYNSSNNYWGGYTTTFDNVTLNTINFNTDSNLELKNNSHITITGSEVVFYSNTLSIEEGSYLTLSADALNKMLSDCEPLSRSDALIN